MQKPTLVVMAAGLGSRFGGPKQMTPIDDAGHLIIDFSLYDASLAGFSKVVCIIGPEMRADFDAAIGARIAPHMDLHYAYQQLDLLPPGYEVPPGRTKPWGTAHAVLCAADQIAGPFAVINADDFYGRSAFAAMYDFLDAPHSGSEHAMVGYRVENTLTEFGKVARGICSVNNAGQLTAIEERTHILPAPGGAKYTEDGNSFTFLPGDTIVSMNLWGFQHPILGEMQRRFPLFLDALGENANTAEYFLPSVPNGLIQEGKATVQVLPTAEKWFGVTYREDLPNVQRAIAAMKASGIYPEKLWRKS